MKSCRNKTRDVSHVYHEQSSVFVRYLSYALKVYHSRISGRACYDELRVVLLRQSFKLVVIENSVVVYAVGNKVVVLSGHIDGASVSA